jgi:membrane protease YdiL (CAAX protease family)
MVIFAIIVPIAIVLYIIFLYITNFYQGDGSQRYFIKQKLSGYILFFAVPAIISRLIEFPFTFTKIILLKSTCFLLLPLVASVILVFNHFYTSRNSGIRERYPEMRYSEWSINRVLLNAVGWFLFLFGYEFLFRGIVLYASLEIMAPFWAVVFNITLYAIAHLPKSKDEVIGAFFFGILLCLVTINTGNIWFAVAIHFIHAFSIELFSVRHSKDMYFLTQKIND